MPGEVFDGVLPLFVAEGLRLKEDSRAGRLRPRVMCIDVLDANHHRMGDAVALRGIRSPPSAVITTTAASPTASGGHHHHGRVPDCDLRPVVTGDPPPTKPNVSQSQVTAAMTSG